MLRRLWYWAWGPPLPTPPDPHLAVVEQLLGIQREQMTLFAKQQESFQQWLTLFQPQESVPIGPDQQEEQMRDLVELSATLGNPDAVELLADKDALKRYLTLARISQ